MVRWLEEVNRTDTDAVGSKASNLGELLQQGMDVPKAFIIDSETFDSFLRQSGIRDRIDSQVSRLNPDDRSDLKQTAQTIQQLIEDASIDTETADEIREAYDEINLNNKVRKAGNKAIELIGGQRETASVAVRASPVGSREQGVYSPKVGVRGKDDIVKAVKDAWKEYYTPEALYYRAKQGGSDSVAVIVQKMVKADISCTVFTDHPVSDDTSILIEAVYGLGHGLSDGTTTPDTFIVDRETGQLQEQEIREKRWNITRDPSTGKIQKQQVKRSDREDETLDSDELSEIVNTALDIEEQVGSSLKVDFSIGRNKRYILDVARSHSHQSGGRTGEGNELLNGTVASSGTAEGETAITYDTSTIPSGAIAASVNPETGFLPHMERLNGIITENGAISSNLALHARLFDVPMLVGAANATDILTDGNQIVLDCTSGTVFDGGSIRQDESLETAKTPATPDTDRLTATQLYTLEDELDEADGAVVLDRGSAQNPAWSTRARQPDQRIHQDFQKDFQGGAVLIDSYADLLRLEEAHRNNASTAFLHLERLARDGPEEALDQALRTAQQDDHPECAVIMHSPDRRLIRTAVEHGIETVVVPPEDFTRFQRHLEREERRFMLSKLRDL